MKNKKPKIKPIPVPANFKKKTPLVQPTLLQKRQPAQAKPQSKPQDEPQNEPTAIETFLLLSTAGLKDKNKVLVQFYPDFLKELGEEIQSKLQLLASYQREISKAIPEDCDSWWENEEKNFPKAVGTIISKLKKENLALHKKLEKSKKITY